MGSENETLKKKVQETEILIRKLETEKLAKDQQIRTLQVCFF